jgi:outer membrane lipoprotein-sorting protein
MDFKNGKSLSRRMHEAELDYTYASAKFSCELTIDGEEHSFTVSLRTRKDSVIWMSISKLGIDAARVLITKDTVMFTLGLTEKKYFAGNFSYINQMLHADLDFDMLQALLFGNSAEFYDEDEKLNPGRDKNTCLYFLSTVRKKRVRRIAKGEEQPKESAQTIWLDPQTFKIVTTQFDDIETRRKFTADYSDFQAVEKFTAPFKMLYTITAEKNIKAEIKYARIGINEPQKFPFNIPPNYERIEFKK